MSINNKTGATQHPIRSDSLGSVLNGICCGFVYIGTTANFRANRHEGLGGYLAALITSLLALLLLKVLPGVLAKIDQLPLPVASIFIVTLYYALTVYWLLIFRSVTQRRLNDTGTTKHKRIWLVFACFFLAVLIDIFAQTPLVEELGDFYAFLSLPYYGLLVLTHVLAFIISLLLYSKPSDTNQTNADYSYLAMIPAKRVRQAAQQPPQNNVPQPTVYCNQPQVQPNYGQPAVYSNQPQVQPNYGQPAANYTPSSYVQPTPPIPNQVLQNRQVGQAYGNTYSQYPGGQACYPPPQQPYYGQSQPPYYGQQPVYPPTYYAPAPQPVPPQNIPTNPNSTNYGQPPTKPDDHS